jgi:hypothetical protein
VRRFDDGISFWLFVWAGPLEAALVLLMVSLELGFVPAVCGMAAMLAVIPIQVIQVGAVQLTPLASKMCPCWHQVFAPWIWIGACGEYRSAVKVSTCTLAPDENNCWLDTCMQLVRWTNGAWGSALFLPCWLLLCVMCRAVSYGSLQ